jgi:hypothetical protein
MNKPTQPHTNQTKASTNTTSKKQKIAMRVIYEPRRANQAFRERQSAPTEHAAEEKDACCRDEKQREPNHEETDEQGQRGGNLA